MSRTGVRRREIPKITAVTGSLQVSRKGLSGRPTSQRGPSTSWQSLSVFLTSHLWLFLLMVAEGLCQTQEVVVFCIVQRLFPCGKSVPGIVPSQDGRSGSPLREALKLPTYRTLQRSVVDDPVVAVCTGRTLQSRSDCYTYSDRFEDATPLHRRAVDRTQIETQSYHHR